MGALFESNASTAQTTAQTTTQLDNRIVSGDGSTNLSNSSGNTLTQVTNNTTTDFGAIQGSMALIASGQREQSNVLNHTLDVNQNVFTAGVGFAEHALQGVISNSSDMMRTTEQVLNGQAASQSSSIAAIKDAFTTSKAGEQRILVGAALAIVAVVALRK
jgi:hypothetical protein